MKKKAMILVVVGILTLSGISFAYGAGRVYQSFNNSNRSIKCTNNSGIQSTDRFNNMIKIMKENGFVDEANAMENKDFDAMDKLMTSISAEDYKKMSDIMQNNGYGVMSNMMKSISREDNTTGYRGMMRR